MGDAEQMWTTVVPALEGEEAELVVIGIDTRSDDPGQRAVEIIGARGYEGEEGVFYLLSFDLGMRYERDGDRLAVLLLTSPGPPHPAPAPGRAVGTTPPIPPDRAAPDR
jgi:hypothetical protein